MSAFAISLLNALAAFPMLLGYIRDFALGVTTWYLQGSTKKTLSMISSAAALSSKAKTKEERYEAIAAWRDALSRGRM